MNAGLEELQKELDRTAVISDSFKKLIMGWAYEAVRIAHEAGREAGIDEQRLGHFRDV